MNEEQRHGTVSTCRTNYATSKPSHTPQRDRGHPGPWAVHGQPGLNTQLFFLDEATALAAGHRPCAFCRNPRYKEFKAKWIAGNPDRHLDTKCSIVRIDAELHKDRWLEDGGQKTYAARLASLPDGVIVSNRGEDESYLWWNQALYLWSAQGYHATKRNLRDQMVTVHTPLSTVNALRAGFVPMIHPGVRSERD